METPDGPLCFACGTTAEVWPLLETHSIIAKYHDRGERTFKHEFETIRSRLSAVISRAFPEESVSRVRASGVELYLKLMFVPLKTFIAKWQPPASLDIKTVRLTGLDGRPLEGVLFNREGFPREVPAYTVRLSSSKALEFERRVVNPTDIQRSGQATETYSAKLASECKKRPRAMQSLADAECATDVQTKYEKAQADMAQRNRERDFQQASTDVASAAGQTVQLVSKIRHGRLGSDEEDDGAYLPEAKKPRRKPVGRAAPSGRARGAKLGLASASSAAVHRMAPRLGVGSAMGGSIVSALGKQLAPSGASDCGSAAGGGAATAMAFDTPPVKKAKTKLEDSSPEDYLSVLRGNVKLGREKRGAFLSRLGEGGHRRGRRRHDG